ncbi:MAG TPA: flavin reductase family protein [Actinophytocola sp.]|uniref:flavin reductase family protein n=1 Tax=Actinophytocola sp. TaxID=1872138 RepID=UPI002DDD4B0B|nr:flavin reductase family protein [Actinophytocola sp.]HEV2779910.1 flavin reductase family protein [Actinophytocola sp.]
MTMSLPAILPSESDVESFWQAGLRFATGVSVITVGSGERVHGTTVSAFTVVSRCPALVSLCLRTSSGLAEFLIDHRHFAVNILSREQSRLARHFANPARGQGPDQFTGVAWTPGFDAGVPLLDRAVCWLWCQFRRVVPAGDHQLVLAGVTAAKTGTGAPLLYYAGRLHPGAIGEEVA